MARGRTAEVNGIHKSPDRRTSTAEYLARYETDARMGIFQLACTEGQEYRGFSLPIPHRSEQLRSDRADVTVTGHQVRRRTAVACGRCRKRKIRCSGDEGNGIPCRTCKNAGANQCTFSRVGSLELQCVQQLRLPNIDASNEGLPFLTGGMPFAGACLSGMSVSSSLQAGGGEAGTSPSDMYTGSVYHHSPGYYPQEDVKYTHHHHGDREQAGWMGAATPGTCNSDSPVVAVDATGSLPAASEAYPAYSAAYDPLPWNPGGAPLDFSARGYLEQHHRAVAEQAGGVYDTAFSTVHTLHQHQHQHQHQQNMSSGEAMGVTLSGSPASRLPSVVAAPGPVALPNGFPALGPNVSGSVLLPPPSPLVSAVGGGLLGNHHHHLGHHSDALRPQHQQGQGVRQHQAGRVLPAPLDARTAPLLTAVPFQGASGDNALGSGVGHDRDHQSSGLATTFTIAATAMSVTASDTVSCAVPVLPTTSSGPAASIAGADTIMGGTSADPGITPAAAHAQPQLSLPGPPNMYPRVPHAWSTPGHSPLGPLEPFPASLAQAHQAVLDVVSPHESDDGGDSAATPPVGTVPSRTLSGPPLSLNAPPRGSLPPLSALTHSFDASGAAAVASAVERGAREASSSSGGGDNNSAASSSSAGGRKAARSHSYGSVASRPSTAASSFTSAGSALDCGRTAAAAAAAAAGRGDSTNASVSARPGSRASRASSANTAFGVPVRANSFAGLAAYRMGGGKQVARRRRRRSPAEHRRVPVKLEDCKTLAALSP